MRILFLFLITLFVSEKVYSNSYQLSPTVYHTTVIRESGAKSSSVRIRDTQGRRTIVRMTPESARLLRLEGAGVIIDEEGNKRVFSYLSGSTFQELDSEQYPFGWVKRSVRGKACPRIPYKTIAVDPKVIPLGSSVFIAETVGMKFPLPDGSTYTHDGIWYAEDIGSKIKGRRMDVFVGSQDNEATLQSTFHTGNPMQARIQGRITGCAHDHMKTEPKNKAFLEKIFTPKNAVNFLQEGQGDAHIKE
jgi:3D (Asp-Asp-Asp) domain-containing protein